MKRRMMRWPSRRRPHARALQDPLLACLESPHPMVPGRPWASLLMVPHPATRSAFPACQSGPEVLVMVFADSSHGLHTQM